MKRIAIAAVAVAAIVAVALVLVSLGDDPIEMTSEVAIESVSMFDSSPSVIEPVIIWLVSDTDYFITRERSWEVPEGRVFVLEHIEVFRDRPHVSSRSVSGCPKLWLFNRGDPNPSSVSPVIAFPHYDTGTVYTLPSPMKIPGRWVISNYGPEGEESTSLILFGYLADPSALRP